MATTYKIGEAAALLNLKTYVLRFWETEFPDIVPLRTDKGQRLYTEENLALLERIRFLLHERGLTIEGARKALLEDKEKGLVYTFTSGMDARPPASEEESAEIEAEAEDGEEPDGEEAVEVTDGVGSDEPPDEETRPTGDDGMAVRKFLSQYNLPGISKTYPIHDPPLFERREYRYRETSPMAAPVDVISNSGQALPQRPGGPAARPGEHRDESGSPGDGSSAGEDFAYLLESALSRHKSESDAFLRELATELEAIAETLRGD